jgi:hypothetical protein
MSSAAFAAGLIIGAGFTLVAVALGVVYNAVLKMVRYEWKQKANGDE